MTRPTNPLTGRFTVEPTSGCHLWSRAIQSRGYGVVWFDGKVRLAHRVSWFLAHGSWPGDGLVVDHICNTKACVNPAHLRELENWQNVRRSCPAGDTATERRREGNRRSQAKSRGTYSPTYRASRGGGSNPLVQGR